MKYPSIPQLFGRRMEMLIKFRLCSVKYVIDRVLSNISFNSSSENMSLLSCLTVWKDHVIISGQRNVSESEMSITSRLKH